MSPAESPLTLMAVHAHPDDEASSTGGILARYAAEGVRTVVVMCTNGELGDMPSGEKPENPEHDERIVVSTRRRELEASREILNVTHLELLGYRDSGMMGWPHNETQQSFWNMPVEDAAQPLITLMERYRPQVVVTYDANGFYGHPDHIQAHRITMAATSRCDIPDKVYATALPKSLLPAFAKIFAEDDVDPPEAIDQANFGTDDELISASIDCTPFVEHKFEAIAAHASQTDNDFFLRLNRDAFAKIFSHEYYVRLYDRTDSPIPETDLFAGIIPPR